MFIEQLFTVLIKNNNKNGFNFVLDNIDSLENISELSNMLSTGISKNMKFIIVTRSFEDIINKYGNYVTKLSNNAIVNKEIKLTIDGEDLTIDKENITKNKVYPDIEYPILSKNKIEMFNIEEFVRTNLKDDLENSFKLDAMPEANLDNNKSIDELIKNIDEKIEQLNQEEKMANVEKKNIEVKSDFEQFKTE